jgi:hypothetical protein
VEDVRDGLVSTDSAKQDYGVRISTDGELDAEGSAMLRAEQGTAHD